MRRRISVSSTEATIKNWERTVCPPRRNIWIGAKALVARDLIALTDEDKRNRSRYHND